MVKLLLKYKFEILAVFILLISYFAFRLPNLTLQPIFADEAIYVRWAQVMRAEPTLRFVSLSDGKTPLFMWTLMPLLKIFDDPLFAGRFLSVLSGVSTLFGVFFLARQVFGTKAALWSAFLYAITPYAVFFDRMALVDSMLATFTVWSVNFAIWLVRNPRLDLAMILGYLLGGGLLVKTPGMVNLLMVPITIIGFNFKKAAQKSLPKLLLFWIVALGIALLMYNILRLGPGFEQLSSRNADYMFSPLELVGRPLDPFIPHFKDIADWWPKLLGWPTLLLAIGGGGWVLLRNNRLGIVILMWALIPLMIQMAFLRTFTARYLFFSVPLLMTLAGGLLTDLPSLLRVKPARFAFLACLALIAYPAYFNYLLLNKPEQAPLPKAERKGYFEEWTAGYGFPEIAQYLVEKSKHGPVVVGTEGYFGTLPDGLYIYLDKAGIPVIGSTATISAQLRTTVLDNQTFFVGNKNNLKHIGGVEKVLEYPKVGQDATVLYKVLP